MVHNVEINPNAYYCDEGFRKITELSIRAINTACSKGELRFTERAGRRFFRGQWIIDWLEGSTERQPIGPEGSLPGQQPVNA